MTKCQQRYLQEILQSFKYCAVAKKIQKKKNKLESRESKMANKQSQSKYSNLNPRSDGILNNSPQRSDYANNSIQN